jgi:hypothetical protein
MTARLDDATAGRLAKILGMLGSDHVGERAAAAAKAHALVHRAGLTWREVLTPSPSIAPQLGSDCSWRRMAAECRARKARLTPAESEFVAKIITWKTEPSPKQLAWLMAIHARLHRAGARG